MTRVRALLATGPILTACSVVAACLALTTACSLQTLGAPHGRLTLTATFDDVQNLVAGNTVQTSNVVIGSVTHVRLHGYQAEVTMSITDGHRIPAGTTAITRQTSLLGEYFVDLAFPAGFDPGTAQFLKKGDRITATRTDPAVEQLAGRAGQLIGAVSANDLSAIVQAGSQALGGRGPELNHLIAQASQLVTALGQQRGAIGAAIDNLGRLGSSLAPLGGQFGTLLDSVASTTQMLVQDRDKFFAALKAFNQLAVTTNDVILQPHQQQFTQLILEANAILGSLADNKATLQSLTDNFAMFVPRIVKTISAGQLLVSIWADPHVSIAGVAAPAAPASAPASLPALPAYLAVLLR
jgi:phospholipid/cholesterol/gamma-HCH transport system substrate-binding protein